MRDGRFRKAFVTNIERVMRPVEEIKVRCPLLRRRMHRLTHPPPRVLRQARLQLFCAKYEDAMDDDGRRMFSSKTKPAIELQHNTKVKFLTEPIRMYINKGTDSRGLPVVQSFRGTNSTETWHNNVVDFVTGESTGAELARQDGLNPDPIV